MENDEIKSLKRQRSFLIGIVAVLAFVTFVSMVYAFVQKGIAEENLHEAIRLEQIAKANERVAKEQTQLAFFARKDAEEQRIRAEAALKKITKK